MYTQSPKDMYCNVHSRLNTTSSWKLPNWPSVLEWANKLWYVHTTEYYTELRIRNYIDTNSVDESHTLNVEQKKWNTGVHTGRFYLYKVHTKANSLTLQGVTVSKKGGSNWRLPGRAVRLQVILRFLVLGLVVQVCSVVQWIYDVDTFLYVYYIGIH